MQTQLVTSEVLPSLVLGSLIAKEGGAGNWRGKPADWSDIRKDCPANSIALYAAHTEDFSQYDNLGFTANCTGGYNVFIDKKKYGTFTSGSQCSITWSNTTLDKDLPVGYKRLTGMTMDNNCYYLINDFYPTGADTLKFSFEWTNVTQACNVLGCYTTTSAQDNLSLYIGNNPTAKYLRYNGGTYSSYCLPNKRYDVEITPTGSKGFEIDETWTQKDFTCSVPLCVGITGTAATSAKLIGNLYGNIEVVGKLNLIPCERLSDNEIGYYDTVSNTFYEPTGTTPTSLGYDNSHLINGDDITTPSALKAHKIWIEPSTSGNNITQFRCRRVAESGDEEQGVLWGHFNIKNSIKLVTAFYADSTYKNPLLTACTASGNKINIESLEHAFAQSVLLEYLPKFDGNNNSMGLSQTFRNCQKLKTVLLDNMTITSYYHMCNSCYILEDIKCKNVTANSTSNTSISSAYYSCYALKATIPTVYPSTLQRMDNYLTYTENLKDTIIDTRTDTSLKVIGTYGSASYFMDGLKGLRVSSEAPFDYTTAPQINISYTGMDREAIVTLFNDLPTVSSGQIINITGCSGAMSLDGDDIEIATYKGWTVVGGPALTTYYRYNNSSEGNIYTKDTAAADGSVFNIENVTVVGDLSVENDICSKFSGSRYIRLDTPFNPGSSPWEVTIKYKTSSMGSTQYLFDSCKGTGDVGRYGFCLFISSDSHFAINNTYNGYDWSITSSNGGKGTYTVLANTDYWIKSGWDGSKYYIKYSLTGNENDYQEDVSVTSSTATYANLAYSYIGVYSTSSFGSPLNGQLNLGQTYYTIGNTTTRFGYYDTVSELYNSSFQKFNPQPSFTVDNIGKRNVEIVGILTENNGVYSNFSTTSFIRLGTHNFGSAFNFKTRATIAAYTNSSQVIMSGRDYGYDGDGGGGKSYVNIYVTSTYKWGFELGTGNDSTWSISETSSVSATVGETYDIIFCYEEGYYRVKISVAGQNNYTTICEQASASQIMVNPIPVVLGINKSYMFYHGSIDIKETELTVDGVTTDFWNATPYITIDNNVYDYTGTVQH